jgi:hypothetical protein
MPFATIVGHASAVELLRRAVGAHLAVGDGPAVELRAVDVESLLDLVRLGGDTLEQRRIDLLLQVDAEQHVHLARQDRVGDLRFLDRL